MVDGSNLRVRLFLNSAQQGPSEACYIFRALRGLRPSPQHEVALHLTLSYQSYLTVKYNLDVRYGG